MGLIFSNLKTFTNPVVVSPGVAAGTSDTQTTTAVDMTGFDGVQFQAIIGTVTSTGLIHLKVQHSDDNSTFADVLGSNSTAIPVAGNALIAEVYKPTKRYVRAALVRATANVVITSVTAIQYGPTFGPPAVDSSVASFVMLNSPPSGTA